MTTSIRHCQISCYSLLHAACLLFTRDGPGKEILVSMKGPMSGMPGCAAAVAFLKLLGITFDESSVLAKLKVDDIVELCQSS